MKMIAEDILASKLGGGQIFFFLGGGASKMFCKYFRGHFLLAGSRWLFFVGFLHPSPRRPFWW